MSEARYDRLDCNMPQAARKTGGTKKVQMLFRGAQRSESEGFLGFPSSASLFEDPLRGFL